jgi:hypothetical protein
MNSLLFKILKYLAIALTIYLIFRFVPNSQISNSDILLISMITIFSLLLLETLCSTSEHMTPVEQANMCSSVCSVPQPTQVAEHMVDVPKPVEKKPEVKQEVKQEIKLENDSDGSIYNYQNTLKQLEASGVQRTGSRAEEGTLNSEIQYDRNSGYSLPLPENYRKEDFEYGDSFLPPEKWYPQPPFPPVCVAEKKCPVCPVYTTGTPIDVKEWNNASRVTQPDEINVKYVKEKLNSGR